MVDVDEPSRTEEPESLPKEPDWRRHVWTLVLALLVAVMARQWWLNLVDTQPVTDFDWYFERAVSIMNGHGYAVNGDATAYWPVGYPAVLAVAFKVFGATVAVGKALNTALTLGCVVLCWILALRLFKSPVVAFLSALVLAVHPAYLAYSGILASEPLFTFLMLGGTVAYLAGPSKRHAWMIVAGLAFGLATLVRPQAIVLPLILAACCWLTDGVPRFRGRTLLSLAVVLGVIGVVLTPWTIRNYHVFGRLVFVSTNGGDNLLIGNSERSEGRYLNPNELGYDFSGLNEAQRDKAASAAALDYIKGHGERLVSIWPAKLAGTFLGGTDSPYWAFQTEKGHMKDPGTGSDKPQFKAFQSYSGTFTEVLLYAALVGAVISLIAIWWGTKFPLLVIGYVGYTAGLSILFFGNPRFGFPVVPFFAMISANSVQAVVDLVGSLLGRKRREVDLEDGASL